MAWLLGANRAVFGVEHRERQRERESCEEKWLRDVK
jgi:hypothetical protein